MRRINKFNLKIGIIILCFSFLLTSLFLFMFTVFSERLLTATDISAKDFHAYTVFLNDKEAMQLFSEDGFILLAENVTDIKTYNQNYISMIMKNSFPYAIGFCLLVFLLSIVLWFVLKSLQSKNNQKMIKQLNQIEESTVFIDTSPELKAVYEGIQNKFQNHLEDYQRLNSYLSHEQKNMLAILRTQMENADLNDYLPKIDDLTESIDDILTLSEDIHALKAPVDVALICAEVCDRYSAVYPLISFDFNENANTEIMARKRWIDRAVSNLVSNAIKYGNGNPIEVRLENKHHCVTVSVKDYGIGMSAKEQKNIFNHRYRINHLKNDGYGIGLSLVSHVCDLCGGFVMVESKENIGSTFYLSFSEI